tara:strand:+ start:557 stop:1309 length:753 start_codon:yes stop_codon:yes gene_type:complete
MDTLIMNIKEIVQTPYSTAPRFTPIDFVEFKDYLQEAFEERLIEYNTLMGDMSFESDLAVEKKLVKKTSEAMNIEPFSDIIEMGLEIPDDVIIMYKGKVEAAFVAMASSWNPRTVQGKTLAEVHQPVADNEMLLKASDGIWRSMTSGKSFHRHVWGISPLKKLSNHPRHKKPEIKNLDDLYFRIEHERTLTVDEDTAAFFIDVEVMPLSTVFHLKTEYRNLIKDSINSMSENILAYKNLEHVKELINVHD